jgi:hypothetical protein
MPVKTSSPPTEGCRGGSYGTGQNHALPRHEGGRAVKGVNFVNLRDAGDPVKNAEFYQAEGADELAMLDIAATLENRKTRLEWVRVVSAVIGIPLTVGGGIASLQDIEETLKAGADKVSMYFPRPVEGISGRSLRLGLAGENHYGAVQYIDRRDGSGGREVVDGPPSEKRISLPRLVG